MTAPTTYRRNTQPWGQRLSRTTREAQIRAGLAGGPQSLGELAAAMVCSLTLVSIYAARMDDVVVERVAVATRAGTRLQRRLSLVVQGGGGA